MKDETILAWRSALWAAALNALGAPLELFIGRQLPPRPLWPIYACSLVGVILFVWLSMHRKNPTRAGAAAAFLLNTAALVVMLWIEHRTWATMGARWTPFQANKLGAFTVGLLAPELWVGVLSIAAYGLSAMLQWFLLPEALRSQLAIGEPLITVVFCLFAAALLLQSLHRYALQRRLVARSQRAEALDRLARALLAVRDLANTPVQTIEITIAILMMKHPEATASLKRLERALVSLRNLNQVLSQFEGDVEWHAGDESFDPLEVLRHDPLA